MSLAWIFLKVQQARTLKCCGEEDWVVGIIKDVYQKKKHQYF